MTHGLYNGEKCTETNINMVNFCGLFFTEYSHYGCYYEVYSCGTPPYYIDTLRQNVSIFDVCLELARKKGVKHFGVQAMQQNDCITGPNFLKPQSADCLKRTMCNQDKTKLSSYSYDLYVIKDVTGE